MSTRTAANSLVKRTAFSSAINIFPNDVPTPEIATTENETTKRSNIRPYTDIPGPKGLPIIGNSWRFAPIIGKIYFLIFYADNYLVYLFFPIFEMDFNFFFLRMHIDTIIGDGSKLTTAY